MKKVILSIFLIFLVFNTCSCIDDSNTIELDTDAYDLSEEDYKSACEEISYEDFRYEAQYMEEHKKIKCTGEVTQICAEQDSDSNYYSEYRISITKQTYAYIDEVLYMDDIYVYYLLGDKSKLLENDIVTLYGEATESYTYETTGGSVRTIPAMVAVYVDIK